MRKLTYSQAINEALDQCMYQDTSVILIGEGVPDGIFGSTIGLKEKYPARVFDSPLSENGVTGFCIGAALHGLRPVMVHQRMDFSLLAVDQIINNAAKWHFTFGRPVPMVIRMVIGRGWGQGPQHSQSLQALYGAIPGLKVVMPTTPKDAKGMLISAIRDDNPVLILEHRWLYDIVGDVPENVFDVALNKANIIQHGNDVTIVGLSYANVTINKAIGLLKDYKLSIEHIDARCVSPLDINTIASSVNKTGCLIVVDTSHKNFSVGSEICRQVTERCFSELTQAPVIMGNKDIPAASSHHLMFDYYVTEVDIANAILKMFYLGEEVHHTNTQHDVPDKNYSLTF